jgi:exopolysaccharide biosynthesis WecB/TagA/CpsF family protein
MNKCTNVLGIPVSTLSRHEIVGEIQGMIGTYQRDGKCRYIATLNMDFLANCFSKFTLKVKSSKLYNFLQEADLITADGMPIVVMGRLQNNDVKERVTGADLVYDIASMAAENKHSIYLIGQSDDLCEQAVEIFKEENKHLKIAGYSSPYVDDQGFSEDEKLIDKINDSGADILYIGLGNPKQELWFRNHRSKLKVAVSIGIGGSLSFVTGQVKRAPKCIQKVGLECVYRLCSEPQRLWKRYSSQLCLLLSLTCRGRLGFWQCMVQKLGLDREITLPVKYKKGVVFFSGIVNENSILAFMKILKTEKIKWVNFEEVVDIRRNAVGDLIRALQNVSRGSELTGLSNRVRKELKAYFADSLLVRDQRSVISVE